MDTHVRGTAAEVSSDPRMISERLLERGLGHRESASYGKREVFRIATSEVLGRFTAGDAVETFLRTPFSAEVSS